MSPHAREGTWERGYGVDPRRKNNYVKLGSDPGQFNRVRIHEKGPE